MPSIYIDNNATTRIAPEVFEAMLPYLTEFYGNPSSIHRVGARATVAMKESREKVADFFNCREAEVTFTGSGTESNNTAIRGVLDASPDKRHIITSTTEHPSVLELCRILEKQNYRVTYLAVDEAGCGKLALGCVGVGEERLVDLLLLCSILHRSCVPLRLRQCRQQQPDEQRDDRNHHEQLNQGKSLRAFHVLISR